MKTILLINYVSERALFLSRYDEKSHAEYVVGDLAAYDLLHKEIGDSVEEWSSGCYFGSDLQAALQALLND
jgi:hypothetical protein